MFLRFCDAGVVPLVGRNRPPTTACHGLSGLVQVTPSDLKKEAAPLDSGRSLRCSTGTVATHERAIDLPVLRDFSAARVSIRSASAETCRKFRARDCRSAERRSFAEAVVGGRGGEWLSQGGFPTVGFRPGYE